MKRTRSHRGVAAHARVAKERPRDETSETRREGDNAQCLGCDHWFCSPDPKRIRMCRGCKIEKSRDTCSWDAFDGPGPFEVEA